MAREVIERLVDDLDGGDAAETVSFGLDGASYEIDLSKRNASALRKALERYVEAARQATTTTSRRPARRKAAAPRSAKTEREYDLARLREWAGANDITVPARGRIPRTIVEQYVAAGRP